MKKVFYEKVGRRYRPVYEYDSTLMDAFPEGAHLVMCYPGGKSVRFNVDPNRAAMIAAGRVAEDAISQAVVQASLMRPRNNPVTEEQRVAWENLCKAFGTERYYVEIPSAREIAEAGVKAMQAEAEQLMQDPAVRQAYEHFQLLCELTKKSNDKSAA